MDRYNRRIQAAMAGTVWIGRDAATTSAPRVGKVVTQLPYSGGRYWLRTRFFRPLEVPRRRRRRKTLVMLEVVLIAPQIASNTGSIIRLCANAGRDSTWCNRWVSPSTTRRCAAPGLPDHHELAETRCWDSWEECRTGVGVERRWFATTSGATQRRYDDVEYQTGDVVVFGCEADGLPPAVLDAFAPGDRLKIPMRPFNRSINLANAVSIVVYEAWRQHDFAGSASGTFDESRRRGAS